MCGNREGLELLQQYKFNLLETCLSRIEGIPGNANNIPHFGSNAQVFKKSLQFKIRKQGNLVIFMLHDYNQRGTIWFPKINK